VRCSADRRHPLVPQAVVKTRCVGETKRSCGHNSRIDARDSVVPRVGRLSSQARLRVDGTGPRRRLATKRASAWRERLAGTTASRGGFSGTVVPVAQRVWSCRELDESVEHARNETAGRGLAAEDVKLRIQLGLDAGADAEELDEQTANLRRELLELEVKVVDRNRVVEPPPGARAADAATFGTLLVGLANTASALSGVVRALRSWLSRGEARSVKLELGGDTLELTGVSSEQQERLIEAWIARHADS
jgi:hypothetical protein